MSKKLADRVWIRPVSVRGRPVFQLVSVVAGSRVTRIYWSVTWLEHPVIDEVG